jgi:hypothetical protein
MRVQLDQTRQVFEDLRAYIAAQPELSEFLPVAAELEQQAEQLAGGRSDIGPLIAGAPASMPSRYFAEAIIRIVSRLPPIGPDLANDAKLGLARLLENLVVGITGSIFLGFPDAVPRAKHGRNTRRHSAMRSEVGFLSFAQFRGDSLFLRFVRFANTV